MWIKYKLKLIIWLELNKLKTEKAKSLSILCNFETSDTTSVGPAVEPTYVHVVEMNYENTSQGLDPWVIPYQANQSVDPQLWNGNFCPIFLFEVDEYLKDFFFRLAAFIKQCPLENRIAKNILQITEFMFAAWGFLSATYKSG